MGGQDKGLTLLNGRPMIAHVIDAMRPQVGGLLINANRNLSLYQEFGYPVVADAGDDFAGPLAGIAAGLQHAGTPLLLTAPCDGPWLPADIGQRLLQQLLVDDADLCVAHDGERLQPVFGLFRHSLLPSIMTALAAGHNKLRLWMREQRHTVADFSDHPDAFINVNTPQQQQQVEQIILQQQSE